MSRFEVRVAGFGGQGIIKAGVILGEAFSSCRKGNVTETESYGATMRGGMSRADIVISDKQVDYPKVKKADVLIAMSQQAYDEYRNDVKEEGFIVVDSTEVSRLEPARRVQVYEIPATEMARKMGMVLVANMVMLGAFTALTRLISVEEMEKVIKEEMPLSAGKINVEAFRAGYEYAQGLRVKADSSQEYPA